MSTNPNPFIRARGVLVEHEHLGYAQLERKFGVNRALLRQFINNPGMHSLTVVSAVLHEQWEQRTIYIRTTGGPGGNRVFFPALGLLTVGGYSRRYGIPRRTVRRMCKDGRIAARKHGGQWLIFEPIIS